MPAIMPLRRKRVIRNPGLCDFARQQNVTVPHAYRVVMGERQSNRLLTAWQQFNAQRNQSLK